MGIYLLEYPMHNLINNISKDLFQIQKGGHTYVHETPTLLDSLPIQATADYQIHQLVSPGVNIAYCSIYSLYQPYHHHKLVIA